LWRSSCGGLLILFVLVFLRCGLLHWLSCHLRLYLLDDRRRLCDSLWFWHLRHNFRLLNDNDNWLWLRLLGRLLLSLVEFWIDDRHDALMVTAPASTRHRLSPCRLSLLLVFLDGCLLVTVSFIR
jgi:hypothetical protein